MLGTLLRDAMVSKALKLAWSLQSSEREGHREGVLAQMRGAGEGFLAKRLWSLWVTMRGPKSVCPPSPRKHPPVVQKEPQADVLDFQIKEET